MAKSTKKNEFWITNKNDLGQHLWEKIIKNVDEK